MIDKAFSRMPSIHPILKSLPPKIQIQELDTKTAKATFPLLKGKRLDATVDYVFSGSRLKV